MDALTADGAVLTIRPVAEPDVAAMADMFGRSSAASLRLRFFVAPGEPVLALEIARSPGRPPRNTPPSPPTTPECSRWPAAWPRSPPPNPARARSRSPWRPGSPTPLWPPSTPGTEPPSGPRCGRCWRRGRSRWSGPGGAPAGSATRSSRDWSRRASPDRSTPVNPYATAIAGGANVLAADAAEAGGLRLPPQVAGLANPLDLGAGGSPEALRSALSTMAGSGEADAVLAVVAVIRTNDPTALRAAIATVADAHRELPFAVVVLGPATPPRWVSAGRTVHMTAMPQLVSLFDAAGGGAAALLATAHILPEVDLSARVTVPGALDIVIGAVAFSGSPIAAGKLQGWVPGQPIVFRGACLLTMALALTFVIAGALVGASGSILTKQMADAMNRSIPSILLGGFGTGDTPPGHRAVRRRRGPVRPVSAEDVGLQLAYADRMVIVPRYGLAAAQARSVVVIKRSMGHGYAGIDNELYTDPNTGMLFADAKQGISDLLASVRAFVR